MGLELRLLSASSIKHPDFKKFAPTCSGSQKIRSFNITTIFTKALVLKNKQSLGSFPITVIKFWISDPPGDPFIDGYDPKQDNIRRGQMVELTCRSRGGNPLAQLVWYKNGEEIQHTTKWVTVKNSSKFCILPLLLKAYA